MNALLRCVPLGTYDRLSLLSAVIISAVYAYVRNRRRPADDRTIDSRIPTTPPGPNNPEIRVHPGHAPGQFEGAGDGADVQIVVTVISSSRPRKSSGLRV